MNIDVLDRVLRLLWMLTLTLWLSLASESNEPVVVKRDRRSDIAVVIVSIGWVVLLLLAFDGPQIIPRIMSLRIIGSGITLIGIVFAISARFYLGSNWDAFISLKLRHKLVRTGPYAIVQHPIYAGFMVALVGSVLNFGHLRSLIAAIMVIAAWVYKSGLEEAILRDHFGIEYDEYSRNVKRMIPWVW